MSVVTALKTWQIATLVSDVLSSSELNECSLERKIKDQRKAFGNTVLGSGNATVGALDGVDRWTTDADLYGDFVHGGSSVSRWMAMRQPGSSAADIIVHSGSGESDWSFIHSPSGVLTGGSVGVRPTATDETVLYTNTFHGRDDGGHAAPLICHLWVSSDLTCCRQVFFFDHHNYGNLLYDAVDEPSTGWAHPNYAVIDKEGVSKNQNCNCGMLYQFVYGPYSGQGYFNSWGPHGAMTMYGTAESCFDGATAFHPAPWQFAKNKITGNYRNPSRSGLFETGAHADGGWHGKVFDLWWVGDSRAEGDFQFGVAGTTPLDATRQFVIIGDMMLPWNGTIPQTA